MYLYMREKCVHIKKQEKNRVHKKVQQKYKNVVTTKCSVKHQTT